MTHLSKPNQTKSLEVMIVRIFQGLMQTVDINPLIDFLNDKKEVLSSSRMSNL